MTILKEKGVEWIGLPEDITKVKKNAELMKVLLAKRKADARDNEVSTNKQTEVEKREMGPLTINLIELQSDEHEFKCDECVRNLAPGETCGVHLTTEDTVNKVKNYIYSKKRKTR